MNPGRAFRFGRILAFVLAFVLAVALVLAACWVSSMTLGLPLLPVQAIGLYLLARHRHRRWLAVLGLSLLLSPLLWSLS